MSINHFSTDLPETALWWAQQQPQHIMEPSPNTSSQAPHNPHPNSSSSSWTSSLPFHKYHHHHHLHHNTWLNHSMFPPQNPTLNINLNQEDSNEEQDQEEEAQQQQQQDQQEQEHELQEVAVLEKEPMFEKPLTPSDVGKLNRLVIPKQHAEKYFPLNGESGDKGLLLSFEDEAGKYWRFRYSYWNSSQSYVLTKGWSRYVKEKQLDAGDVVLFERHRTEADRFFIGWRRKGETSSATTTSSSGMMVQGSSGGVWGRGLYSCSSPSNSAYHPYPPGVQHGHGANVNTTSVPYQPDSLHAGSVGQQNQTMPAGNSKTLRLFGVNLECQLDEGEPSTPDASSLSSQGPPFQSYSHSAPYSFHGHNPMDITLSRDVNQMGNRQG
ncbi:hypothetical protein Tsubulata_009667 [Turnera subulata]|uniref:TF-B3 domain-containing protein n=1 Tax=Turnera subulata TaxID=218843 RepID=A0A9Q0J740_9ROSI|nr:hypothetical protein Tsubulata_009667 [Turnera subulata]